MKKILIVGSSMAMPRSEIKYEDTWIYNLKMHLDCHIIDKSRRASTSKRLISEGGGDGIYNKGADLLEYYSPNIVITQIGITDCAPRLLGQGFVTKILNNSPKRIRDKIYLLLKKKTKRKAKNAYVKPDEFIINWQNYLERAQKIKTMVIIIKISKPTNFVLKKNPALYNSIIQYNLIYDKLAKSYDNVFLIEPFTAKEIDRIAIDEFHVNKEGHQIVFAKIKTIIKKQTNNGVIN